MKYSIIVPVYNRPDEVDELLDSLTRQAYSDWWAKTQAQMQDAFLHSRVDSVSIRTDEDFVPALLSLFKRRS